MNIEQAFLTGVVVGFAGVVVGSVAAVVLLLITGNIIWAN